MDSTNEKLVFQLENKDKKETVYQYEVGLTEFQREILKDENISFFYTFKDISLELEDKLTYKITQNTDCDEYTMDFIIKFSDKILHKISFDTPMRIDEYAVEINEMALYFLFEKLAKIMVDKISEEHKNIILSNIEKK